MGNSYFVLDIKILFYAFCKQFNFKGTILFNELKYIQNFIYLLCSILMKIVCFFIGSI